VRLKINAGLSFGYNFPIKRGLASKLGSNLDRVSTGSGNDLVKPWESKTIREYRMLITDQVATAPCTDPIQV